MIKRFISLLFIAAATVSAQQTEPFKAKVDVNLVLLDAVVTDARGNQILGLGKDDFIVKENGVPQNIESVDYFTTRKLLNAPENAAPFNVERVHDERYLIIFFDKPLAPEAQNPTRVARYELGHYLDQHLHPEDRVAVVGHDVRLKVYCDFTNDRKTIQRALDDATMFGRGLTSASGAPASGASILRNIDLDRMMSRTGTQYEALEVLGDGMRPIRARKDLILFSAGIVAPDETINGGMIVNTSRYYEPAVQSLNRANVTIYAINLLNANVDAPEYVHQNLGRLANDTNGDYFRFHASFAAPLQQIEKRTVGYYMITYHPQQPKRGYQPVEVSLRNPEFRVHARAGYSTTD